MGAAKGIGNRERGMAVRRKVLGDAHVDRAESAKDRFRRAVPGLDHRGRLGAGLVAAELDAGRALDASPWRCWRRAATEEEVGHASCAPRPTPGPAATTCARRLLHVAIYAGVPAANQAFRIAKKVYAANGPQGKQQNPASDDHDHPIGPEIGGYSSRATGNGIRRPIRRATRHRCCARRNGR